MLVEILWVSTEHTKENVPLLVHDGMILGHGIAVELLVKVASMESPPGAVRLHCKVPAKIHSEWLDG
jgi:hypothetical protein